MARTYWLNLFTVETWKEFQDHGGNVSGFNEKRWSTVRRIKPGDYLLCYLTRVSRWVGLLEVVGEPFFDEEPIWSSQGLSQPCRCPRVDGARPGARRSSPEHAGGADHLSGSGQPEPVAGPIPKLAQQVENRRRRSDRPSTERSAGAIARSVAELSRTTKMVLLGARKMLSEYFQTSHYLLVPVNERPCRRLMEWHYTTALMLGDIKPSAVMAALTIRSASGCLSASR